MGKKEDIITSARSLFTKYSFNKVSMDEIAKKAGVTKKTVYHYFKDKDELVKYFISEELENIKNEFEKIDQKKESFIKKVNEILTNILELQEYNKLLSNLINEKNEENFQNKMFFKVYEDRIIAYLEKKIAEEIKNGNIKKCDPHLVAFVIYKTIYSLTFEYNQEIEKTKLIQEVNAILTNGLLIKGE